MEMLRVCLNNAQHTSCTHSGATSICPQTHLFVNILHETPSVQFLAALIYTKLIGHLFYPSQWLELIQLFFKKIIFFLMCTFLIFVWFNISLDLDTTSVFFVVFFCCEYSSLSELLQGFECSSLGEIARSKNFFHGAFVVCHSVFRYFRFDLHFFALTFHVVNQLARRLLLYVM